jgi:hypothetical protein
LHPFNIAKTQPRGPWRPDTRMHKKTRPWLDAHASAPTHPEASHFATRYLTCTPTQHIPCSRAAWQPQLSAGREQIRQLCAGAAPCCVGSTAETLLHLCCTVLCPFVPVQAASA